MALDKLEDKNLTKIITIDDLIHAKQIHRVDKWRNISKSIKVVQD